MREYEQAIREGNTDAAAKALESMKSDPKLTGKERSLLAQLPAIASMGADRAIPIIRYVAGKNRADSGPQEAKEGFEESVDESNKKINDAWIAVRDTPGYHDMETRDQQDIVNEVSTKNELSNTEKKELDGKIADRPHGANTATGRDAG